VTRGESLPLRLYRAAAGVLLPRTLSRAEREEALRTVEVLAADARSRGRLALVAYWLAEFLSLPRAAWTARIVDRPDDQFLPSRGSNMTGAVAHDIRYALRLLRRAPGFTFVSALTLALGIGATTAIFSVLYAVVMKPLPYRSPERLVTVWSDNTRDGVPQYPMSPANYLDVKAAARTIEGLEAMYAFLATGTLNTSDGAEQLVTSGVTPGMFQLLGRDAALGRAFASSDRDGVIVLSDGYWRRRFGADPNVIGRILVVNEMPATVIGVMPADFTFPFHSMLGPSGFTRALEPDAWILIELWSGFAARNGQPVRSVHFLSVVGRLAPGIAVGEARQELLAVTQRLEEEYPDDNRGLRSTVLPIQEQVVGGARPALTLLLAGAAFVLLIACVNVANLLLARGSARQKEFAVRAALGAGRIRLLAQVLVESAVLALLGGVAGAALAYIGVRVLVAAAPPEIPRLGTIQADPVVLLFLLAVSIATGVLAGVAPALAAWRRDTYATLRDGARTATAGTWPRRARTSLVIAQTAAAVVLAVGAGLLFRSFLTVLQVDPGFRPDRLLTLQLTLPTRTDTPAARLAFYDELFERLEALPGVVATGGTTRLPLGSTNVSTRVMIEGRGMTPADAPEVEFRRAVHNYFTAMGIPLIRGRVFDRQDGPGSAPVVVINQTMAARLWPNEDPIGKRIRMGPNPESPWVTIIGIVGDLRHADLEQPPAPEVYVSHVQNPPVAPFIVIRTDGDPARMAATVRAELKALEKDMAVYYMRPMTDVRAASVAERRFLTGLVLAFGVLALVLTAIGVYGVMALTVAERTQEMGIRFALGAQPRQVLRLVVGQGLLLAMAGVALGLLAARALSPVIANQLYGIAPTDPVALIGVPVVLLLVALLACAVPARRAAQADPLVVLRGE
jgi:putative ABC transport system permease protein